MQSEIKKLLFSFFSKTPLKNFTKGSIVLDPSEKQVFFLTRGVVKMTTSKSGISPTLNAFKPLSIFPLFWVLNNKPEKFSFIALTYVQGYFAPRLEFRKFIKSKPEIALDLLKRIYKGLEGFYSNLETQISGDATARLFSRLKIFRNRFKGKNSKKLMFDLKITQQELAQQTGLARETVAKELKKLEKKGFVSYQGKRLVIHKIPS